jgi:hypothetical protein
MKNFLIITVVSLLCVGGAEYYQGYNNQHQLLSYHNSRYGYEVLYPDGWVVNAESEATSTADTVYFFMAPVTKLESWQGVVPKGSHYISVSAFPNTSHMYPPDWYKAQLGQSFNNYNVTTDEQNTTVFDREAYKVSTYSSGKLLRSDFLIDDKDYILQMSLIPSVIDGRYIPESEFSAIVQSLTFDEVIQN